MRLKKLQILVLKTFIGPFLASFSTALFILVLEFLARYQEDIFGKGFPYKVIAELFFYATGPMVVMALPIALLLASLMTLGKMGEQYELVAIKSAGINVFKVIKPLVFLGILFSLFSFWFASFVVPKANLKLYSLLYDVEKTKPKFQLKPGFFNYTLTRIVVRASEQLKDGLYKDIIIYDHTGKAGNFNVIKAEKAHIYANYQTLYLHFILYNGYRYEEMDETTLPYSKQEHVKIHFDTLHYRVDISEFGFHRTDESLFSSHRYMLNIVKLKEAVDSMKKEPDSIYKDFRTFIDKQLKFSLLDKNIKVINPVVPESQLQNISIYNTALNRMRNIKNYIDFTNDRLESVIENIRKYEIEFYMKIMFPLACLVFMLIGAPLGAIIRKGGIGAPVVISIIFFIIFYVLMTQGKKLAIEGVLPVPVGVGLPIIVLAPISIILTYQIIQDVHLFYVVKDKIQSAIIITAGKIMSLYKRKKQH